MITQQDGSKVDWDNMPLSEMAKGNCLDTYYTLELFKVLKEKLEHIGLLYHYDNMLSPLIPVLGDIELKGMLIDSPKLEELNPKLTAKANEIKQSLYEFKQVNPEDNVGSTNDLVGIFYTRESGFGLYPPSRTKKTSKPQVNKDALEMLENFMETELEVRQE